MTDEDVKNDTAKTPKQGWVTPLTVAGLCAVMGGAAFYSYNSEGQTERYLQDFADSFVTPEEIEKDPSITGVIINRRNAINDSIFVPVVGGKGCLQALYQFHANGFEPRTGRCLDEERQVVTEYSCATITDRGFGCRRD